MSWTAILLPWGVMNHHHQLPSTPQEVAFLRSLGYRWRQIAWSVRASPPPAIPSPGSSSYNSEMFVYKWEWLKGSVDGSSQRWFILSLFQERGSGTFGVILVKISSCRDRTVISKFNPFLSSELSVPSAAILYRSSWDSTFSTLNMMLLLSERISCVPTWSC